MLNPRPVAPFGLQRFLPFGQLSLQGRDHLGGALQLTPLGLERLLSLRDGGLQRSHQRLEVLHHRFPDALERFRQRAEATFAPPEDGR